MPLNDANTTLKRVNTQEQGDHGVRQQRFTGRPVPTPNREQSQMRRPLSHIPHGHEREGPIPTMSREELGQSLRVPVPDATASLRTGASSIPMKHQTSQSTNSSDERQPRRTIFQSPRQPQTVDQAAGHVQTKVEKQDVRSSVLILTKRTLTVSRTPTFEMTQRHCRSETMATRQMEIGTMNRLCSAEFPITVRLQQRIPGGPDMLVVHFKNARLTTNRHASIQYERPQL